MKAKKRFLTSRVGEDEKYYCLECKKQYDISKVDEESWKCLECNEKIIIYSEITRSYIVRNYAYEVKRNDSIFNYYEEEWVKVKGANECDDDDYVFLGLENYGGHITEWNDLVDCYISFFINWDEMDLFDEN